MANLIAGLYDKADAFERNANDSCYVQTPVQKIEYLAKAKVLREVACGYEFSNPLVELHTYLEGGKEEIEAFRRWCAHHKDSIWKDQYGPQRS